MTMPNVFRWRRILSWSGTLGCLLFLIGEARAQTITSGNSGSTFGGTGTGTGGAGAAGRGPGGSSLMGSGDLISGFGTNGSLTGTGTVQTTGGSSVISTSNVFRAYYASPQMVGLTTGSATGTGTRSASFGSPLYTVTTNSTSRTSSGFGNTGGTANVMGGASGTASTVLGASSVGVRRAPGYITTVAFDFERPTTSAIQERVQKVVALSSKLPSRGTILVAVDGNTLILRGTAKNDHERRLAESLVRLTPGVRDLRNELEVTDLPAPRREP